MAQDELFKFENPLKAKFGVEFFKNLPSLPGVYRFLDKNKKLIYVGKAKCLKTRVTSYSRAKPGSSSRKTLRLIRIVNSIDYELCVSEEEALLRENFLLRTLKPFFNRLNTHPEFYCYLVVSKTPKKDVWVFDLTHLKIEEQSSHRIFGPFKSRNQIREILASLVRIQHLVCLTSKEVEPPMSLLKDLVRLPVEIEILEKHQTFLMSYLNGWSDKLLYEYCMALVEKVETIPAWFRFTVQRDLDNLNRFFKSYTKANWRLKNKFKHELRDPNRIGQMELDDLKVKFQSRFT